MRSASGELAGSSSGPAGRLRTGFPSTNAHQYASNDPNSRCTALNAAAFVIVASTLSRLRMIPASASSAARLRAP
jgi:hypothetical protein